MRSIILTIFGGGFANEGRFLPSLLNEIPGTRTACCIIMRLHKNLRNKKSDLKICENHKNLTLLS